MTRHSGRDGARQEAGVTLVETLVALSVVALIALAGFSILAATLRVHERTDGRLERLGAIERAMHVLALDLEQIADPGLLPLGTTLGFRRWGEAGRVLVRYDLDDGALRRTLASPTGRPLAEQRLLAGVEALTWSFHDGAAWHDVWPPSETVATALPSPAAAGLPRAVRARLMLGAGAGLAGRLDRVVRLPAGPAP